MADATIITHADYAPVKLDIARYRRKNQRRQSRLHGPLPTNNQCDRLSASNSSPVSIDERFAAACAFLIALLQRTRSASVTIDGTRVAETGAGILALVGFRRDDRESRIDRFIERILNYRMFSDADGRMNRSLRNIGGELLVVPQFTLAADTNSGNRPSFTPAAAPEDGRVLFDALEKRLAQAWPDSAFGVFGADMQVGLVNDGPVTFWIEVD